MADPTPQSFRLAIGQAKQLVVTMSPAGSIAAQTARFRLRVGATVVTKTVGAGVAREDATNGVWTIDLTTADTTGLRPGFYPWSFWDADTGELSPIAYGSCEVYRTAETG